MSTGGDNKEIWPELSLDDIKMQRKLETLLSYDYIKHLRAKQ